VTALFRHPLGLPIPHTAIIPAQKERLGRGLGRFVANQVFTEAELRRVLGGLDLSGILRGFLTDPAATRPAAQALARDLVKFPQACLRSDRMSAIGQWGMDFGAAMTNEFAHGLRTMASGETKAGAARFAAGADIASGASCARKTLRELARTAAEAEMPKGRARLRTD
jgi:hypothetical protein